ncbi:protein of unknown function [Cohaesibacter sp. ES.047]|uniref:EipB family protein n=1 Tax=Cohaesibacter sp. ES.047 TaxID=1798205 RepID=UPI000BB7E4AA|nr:DUF1849 family protein [Cohaesibacter sp. ES.047]SNY93916.1 protein of unknown function [Cohaesibacter sp. ES.047]
MMIMNNGRDLFLLMRCETIFGILWMIGHGLMQSVFASLVARSWIVLTAGLLLCCWTGLVHADEAEQTLAPYRVIYDINLGDETMSLSKPAAVAALNGRMVFELRGNACEGYATTQRLVTSTEMSEGPTALEDIQMASFEKPEGKGLDFFKRHLVNQQPQLRQRGAAVKKGGHIRVGMAQPSQMAFELPETVLFPAAYMKELLAAAEAGERVFTAHVFDGADDPGEYFQVSTSIGTPFVAAGAEDAAQVPHPALVGIKGWPVTLAYYPSTSSAEDMTPLYEVNTTLFANGVSGNMQFSFEGYALDFQISELELFPASDCD